MGYGQIRLWAQARPEGEIFSLDDAQEAFPDKSRDAVQVALGRLCKGDDPLLARARRGLYARRMLGLPYPVPVPLEAAREVPWIVAGPGAGYSGPTVVNMLGWSTQVPRQTWIAVARRAPKPPSDDIKYRARANKLRPGLSVWEVSLLEAVRYFDGYAELGWSDALDALERRMADGHVAPEGFRGEDWLAAAAAERGLGPQFMPRCRQLASVCAAQ